MYNYECGMADFTCRPSQTVFQILCNLQSKFITLRIFCINAVALVVKLGEIVEMLECEVIDKCSVQETRFRGNWVRLIKGKSAQLKLSCIGMSKGLGRVDIFLTKIWIDKVIVISRVRDAMIVLRYLFKILLFQISQFMPHGVV